MITIAIPAYNQEDTIAESIDSALKQEGAEKEILIIDDCSKDKTFEIANSYKEVRVIRSKINRGIGYNLVNLMHKAEGEYIVYLCGDDIFTSPYICKDICSIFDRYANIGSIDRNYYQFIGETNEICALINEPNILQSSCQPSGMAFRVDSYFNLIFCNDIFIEMPSIVKQYHERKWLSHKINRPTIKARIHKNNTAIKSFYYNGQSPTKNWVSLVGKSFRFPEGFIQMKNRAPQYLFREIWITMKLTPKAMLDWKFWFCAFVAIVTPRIILINVSWFWRKHISTALYARRCK